MKRRSNGDGSISKIKNRNIWRVVLTIDGQSKAFTRHPETGQILRSKKDANEARRLLCVRTHDLTKKVGTFAEFADRWLEARRGVKSGRTVKNNKAEIDNHLNPAFGPKAIDRIRSHEIDRWLAACRATGELVEASLATIYGTFKAIMKAARVRPNPCDDVLQPPRQSQGRDNVQIDPEKIPEFLARVEESPYRIAWLLGMFCAMRTSELCGVDWPHVDWDQAELDVVQAYHQDGELSAPKCNSKRTIALPDLMIDALNKHRARQLSLGHYNPEGPILTNRTGQRMPQSSLNDKWRKIRPAKGMRVHDLRGSHATALISAGIDPLTAAKRLGHADASITLKMYAKMTRNMDRKAANTMQTLGDKNRKQPGNNDTKSA